MEVVSYALPGLGALVEIESAHELKKELPTIVVVMDLSGSMGHLAAIVLSDCIPSAMQQAGYDIATARVRVITFAYHSQRLLIDGQTPTGKDLQATYCQGNGGTYMSGVFELLRPEMRGLKNIALFGISDGEIADVAETLRVAQNFSHDNVAHVEVAMIRLITSRTSNPDTRALACLGQFGTNGTHAIYDVKADSTANAAPWRQEMTQLLKKHLQPRSLLTVNCANIRRTPCDDPSNVLHLCPMVDNGMIFLASSTPTTLNVDGKDYIVREVNELSPHAMQFFCDYASTKLQLYNILGFNIDVMKLWFNKFATLSDNDSGLPITNMKLRMQRFQRRMASGLRGAIADVLQNANQDRLRALNQTQQQAADYLRQSASKALAKRNCKNTMQQNNRGDTNTLAQQVANMVTQYHKLLNCDIAEQECSFFSVCTNHDAFACLAQENKLDFDAMADLDLLRVVGLLGVCYNHKPADFVDPYLFRVNDVFGGTYLNLADLREANSQKIAGVTAELNAPGTHTTITGVVPLRCLSPALFDLFWQHGMKVFEAHCSLNMRRMLAPVRSDMLGERIGVLMHLMRKCSSGASMSTWDQRVFDDLLAQLKMLLDMAPHKQEFHNLVTHIKQKQNFRNLLTGADCVSCMQKPMIALLCYAAPDDPVYISSMLEVLFEFEAYHRARHHFNDADDRNKTMTRLLHIDEFKMLEWFPLKGLNYIPLELHGVYRNELIHNNVDELMQANTTWRVDESSIMNNDLDVEWMPSRTLYATYFDVLTRQHNSMPEPDAACYVSPNRLQSLCSGDSMVSSKQDPQSHVCSQQERRDEPDLALHASETKVMWHVNPDLHSIGRITPRRFFLAMIAAVHAQEEQDRIVDGHNRLFEWADQNSESSRNTALW